jgi:hypothetical protein
VLPLLNLVGAMISLLEEVVGNQLEAKGRILVQAVVEHVVLCFHSRDPQILLELVLQGPAEEPKEATRDGSSISLKTHRSSHPVDVGLFLYK